MQSRGGKGKVSKRGKRGGLDPSVKNDKCHGGKLNKKNKVVTVMESEVTLPAIAFS